MKDNDYHCYPTTTRNTNVPKDAFLVAEYATDDMTVIVTYYIVNGFPYLVYSFDVAKSHQVTIVNLLEVTGDSIWELRRRYDEYLERSPVAAYQKQLIEVVRSF